MGKITIMAPVQGTCPICAARHDPRDPHDRDSLYYQNRFFQRYKRLPTWEDAMAHCTELTKAYWMQKLRHETKTTKETRKRAEEDHDHGQLSQHQTGEFITKGSAGC